MADIFRKQALDKAASPDRLDEYIKVSNPSVWLLLGAICAFLIGVGVWCIFGNIADVQPGLLHVEDGQATCLIDQSRAEKLTPGDTIEAAGVTGTIVDVDGQPAPAAELSDSQLSVVQPTSSWIALATCAIDMPDGDYAANVTVEQYMPLDLLLNRS